MAGATVATGNMKKVLLAGIVLILATVMAWAESAPRTHAFRGAPVDPPFAAPNFTLNDQNGQPFQLSDQRGRIVVLFFGYTHCQDVCPTTLAQFKQVRTQLGSQAERVRFVFITVDPERDSPERMKTYLNAFDPNIVGLGGSEADLDPAWRAYGVYHQKQPGPTADDYSVDHSANVYLVDAQGNLHLTFSPGFATADLAQDIRYLLGQK
jgi:protein SCO1